MNSLTEILEHRKYGAFQNLLKDVRRQITTIHGPYPVHYVDFIDRKYVGRTVDKLCKYLTGHNVETIFPCLNHKIKKLINKNDPLAELLIDSLYSLFNRQKRQLTKDLIIRFLYLQIIDREELPQRGQFELNKCLLSPTHSFQRGLYMIQKLVKNCLRQFSTYGLPIPQMTYISPKTFENTSKVKSASYDLLSAEYLGDIKVSQSTDLSNSALIQIICYYILLHLEDQNFQLQRTKNLKALLIYNPYKDLLFEIPIKSLTPHVLLQISRDILGYLPLPDTTQ